MRRERENREVSEFDEAVIELSRVTRVQAGGKRMRFRALVAVGNRKGKVGIGLKKGQDVAIAVAKASSYGRKKIMEAPIVNGTIPHEIRVKFKAAKIFLKPAKIGTGIIAGRTIRPIFELAGYTDIVAKILGSPNKAANAKAVIKALGSFIQK